MTAPPVPPHWDLAALAAAFDREPTPLPTSPWQLPDPGTWPADDLIAVGADLHPSTLVAAYRRGLFPMHVRRGRIGWWSPDPRGVIPLDGLRVTRSLRQSCRHLWVTADRSFREVVVACADPRRQHGWITPDIVDSYHALHDLGWAHSIEVRDGAGHLVGGLYGVRVGGLFAGESMFHQARDASKVALVALVATMLRCRMTLLDVQWTTPHLMSLGAIDLPRPAYLDLLAAAVATKSPTGR